MTPSVRLLGARRSLLSLVKRLDPERYRPIVCCQTEGELTSALSGAGVEYTVVKTGWWRKNKYWPIVPFALYRISKLIKRRDVGLVHCNEIYPNPIACLAGRLRNTPVVTHIRMTCTPRMANNYKLRKADRIIAVSKASGRDLDHWLDKTERVSIIYNGVAPEEFQTDRPREEIRRELNLPQNSFIVGMIQTWAHRKRQHIAVEAVAKLAGRLPNLRLLLAGGASRAQSGYEKEVRALIAEKGLQDRVWMLPFRSDVAALYQALDLHLQVSGEEGFGRGIIEAGSAGIPSVGTKIGGIPEIIRDGRSGWLIPVDDPTALADEIEKLSADREALEKAGEEARKDATERFSIDAHAKQIMDLYDEVIASRQKS